jgi:hypothetical protein
MNHPPTWPGYIDDRHVCDNRDDATDFICDHPSHDVPDAPLPTPIEWVQPVEQTTPLGNALRALAVDLDNGAPAPFDISFADAGVIGMQVCHAGSDDRAGAIVAWAKILGVTTVRVVRNWASSGDRYEVEGLISEGYRLKVWDAWQEAPAPNGQTIDFVPVALLEPRAFDNPPTWPPRPALERDPVTHDLTAYNDVYRAE